jgi:hypothetical protein
MPAHIEGGSQLLDQPAWFPLHEPTTNVSHAIISRAVSTQIILFVEMSIFS